MPQGCGVEVIAEPGRYMVMSAFTLATTVLNRRTVEDKLSIYVDDSLYGSFNAILYDHQVMIDPVPVMVSAIDCLRDLSFNKNRNTSEEINIVD